MNVWVVAVTPAGNLDPSFSGSVTLSLRNPNCAELEAIRRETRTSG